MDSTMLTIDVVGYWGGAVFNFISRLYDSNTDHLSMILVSIGLLFLMGTAVMRRVNGMENGLTLFMVFVGNVSLFSVMFFAGRFIG